MTKKRAVYERDLEAYYVAEVEKAGGMTEKHVIPGRRGPPDQLTTWPRGGWAKLELVELKTVGGRLDGPQIQDHKRRKALGCIVRVLWTKRQIDEYIAYNKQKIPAAAVEWKPRCACGCEDAPGPVCS